jgi:hypothetical protein
MLMQQLKIWFAVCQRPDGRRQADFSTQIVKHYREEVSNWELETGTFFVFLVSSYTLDHLWVIFGCFETGDDIQMNIQQGSSNPPSLFQFINSGGPIQLIE